MEILSEVGKFWMRVCSGGSKGDPGARPPPAKQNFLNFMQFLGIIWHVCMLAPPPGGIAPPPTRNPGSTPGLAALSNLC